jgi:hypothetical protein
MSGFSLRQPHVDVAGLKSSQHPRFADPYAGALPHVDGAKLNSKGIKAVDVKPNRAADALQSGDQLFGERAHRNLVIFHLTIDDLGYYSESSSRGWRLLQRFDIVAGPVSDLVLQGLVAVFDDFVDDAFDNRLARNRESRCPSKIRLSPTRLSPHLLMIQIYI